MNMAIKRYFSAACFALLSVTSVLSAENLVGDNPYLHLQTGHKDSVNALAITPDSLVLESGGADGNSNTPPAEPGAFICEPLNAAPSPWRHQWRTIHHTRLNWSNRSSSFSWSRISLRITSSSRPTVDTTYPLAQKC
jgi:hypothetical protein